MVAASKTLGRLAEFGGTAFADHVVELEVPRALGLLQNDKDMGRYAAVLIMRELAKHSPGYFHTYVGRALEKIWIPIRDSRVRFTVHFLVGYVAHSLVVHDRLQFGRELLNS